MAQLLGLPNLLELSLKEGALTCLETLDDLKFHAQQNLARICQERESILLTIATGCLEGITGPQSSTDSELQPVLASPFRGHSGEQYCAIRSVRTRKTSDIFLRLEGMGSADHTGV